MITREYECFHSNKLLDKGTWERNREIDSMISFFLLSLWTKDNKTFGEDRVPLEHAPYRKQTSTANRSMIRVHGNRGWTNAGRLFSFPDRRIRLSPLSSLATQPKEKPLPPNQVIFISANYTYNYLASTNETSNILWQDFSSIFDKNCRIFFYYQNHIIFILRLNYQIIDPFYIINAGYCR